MKLITLFGVSFLFVVLGHFRIQRKKQATLERRQFKVAAERAERREEYR